MRPPQNFQRLLVIAAIVSAIEHSLAQSTFVQSVCSDPGCSDNCNVQELNQGACYATDAGSTSAISWCIDGGLALKQRLFTFSSSCTGYSYYQAVGTDQCFSGTSGYVEYSCGDDIIRSANATASTTATMLRRDQLSSSVAPGSGLVAKNISVFIAFTSTTATLTLQGPWTINTATLTARSAIGGTVDVCSVVVNCYSGATGKLVLRTESTAAGQVRLRDPVLGEVAVVGRA